MSKKDAIVFINRIFQDDDFKKSFETCNCTSNELLISFAAKNNYHFTTEELIEGYQRNYKLRWLTSKEKVIIGKIF